MTIPAISEDTRRLAIRLGLFLVVTGALLYAAQIGREMYANYTRAEIAKRLESAKKAEEAAKRAQAAAEKARLAKPVVIEKPVEPKRLLPGMKFVFNNPEHFVNPYGSNAEYFGQMLREVELYQGGLKLTISVKRKNPAPDRWEFIAQPWDHVEDEFGNTLEFDRINTTGYVPPPTQRWDAIVLITQLYGDETVFYYVNYRGQVFPLARKFHFFSGHPCRGCFSFRDGPTLTLNP